MRQNFSDRLIAAGQADAPVVIDGARRHTYADLRRATDAIAGALHAAGVPAGARVGVAGPNSMFWVAGYLAAMRIGVAVPISDKSTAAEIATQLDLAECAAVVADRLTIRRLGSGFADRFVVSEVVLSEVDEVNPAGSSALRQDPAGLGDAALMFTSGSTARPKAVRLTHENLIANTESIVDYLSLSEADRMLVILPFHYVFGASLLHSHLAVGGSLVLCNTFAFPETALDLIDRESCTGLAGVPSSFQLLLRASSYATRSLPSLRLVQQAGGRVPPHQVQSLAAAQPQADFFVMYGQTEASPRLSYLPPDRLHDKAGSVGRGIPGVTLSVVDEQGAPVAPGVQGEVVARGANISPGYLNDPEETARKFVAGTLRTGDLATVDSEGFIYLVGRSDDLIKSWGFRVSPRQIEEVAITHPQIEQAAVVGVPDEDAGQAITLTVVLAAGHALAAQQILRYLAGLLPKHLVPSSVHIVDSLPHNASGKVATGQLRALVQGWRGGSGPDLAG